MQARSSPQRRDRRKALDDIVCNFCKESTPEERFLLCDGCSRGEHVECCGLTDVPARFYFCTHCQTQGDTIKGMIIQELVAAEPCVLTYNEVGNRVATRRLHLQGDMDVTKKSVSAELTRMSNGEIGMRDDEQPLLQRYPDESGVLLYYLTPEPEDTPPASDQPAPPLAAAACKQSPSNMTMVEQAHTPLPALGQQLAVLDMPNADMPGGGVSDRSPPPRLADSQLRTNATRHCTASQTRDKPQAHAAQQGHIARQQRRPRKPDPPYPEYKAGNSLSPMHRSASSPEGDDTTPMQSPVRSIQPAPVQTPAQNHKSLRSQMRKLLSAQSPGEAGHPAQDQNEVPEGLQTKPGPAMLQAARIVHAHGTQEAPHHAPAVPPTLLAAHAQDPARLSAAAEVPCAGLASRSQSRDRPEDRALDPPALAAGPLQAYDAVHKSSTDLPFYTFSEFLRQSSGAPSSVDGGGDVMLEEAAITSPPSMLRDDSPPSNSRRGLPHPQTITDSEDNNMMHQQDFPAGYSPCGTSSLPEATPEPQGSQTLPADAQQSSPARLNTASQATSSHPGLCSQVLLPLQTNLQGPSAQQHTLPLTTVLVMDHIQHPPQPEAIAQQPASANQPVASEGMVQGDVGLPPPHLLLQSGYTGSKPISQPSDSLHDSGLNAGAIATLPPLSASVQTQSAPQSPRHADSASHATGQAASHATGQAASGQHHRAVAQHAVVLSQADIMQQVAQWTDNRLCTVMYSDGVLQIQQVPGCEAADSAVGAVARAQTPRWHPCAYMCARASPLAHGTAMGPQAKQPPHGQPVTQRKRKRDSDVSASSKRQRACRRLHASLRTISCVMIAMWLYPYLTGS